MFIYYESLQPLEPLIPEEAYNEMEVAPGRPGNLTSEQEEKLRALWVRIFQVTGSSGDDAITAALAQTSLSPTTARKGTDINKEKEKDKPKKLRSLFSRKNASSKDVSGTETPDGASVTPATSTASSGRVTPLPSAPEDDKYGQTKHFLETLETQSPESIRETLWAMVKHDHPDALVLRFLRARKWDVEKALVMLISTMNWRHTEMHVDDVIMKEGELTCAEREKADSGVDEAGKRLARDFLAQTRMGKSFIHGIDKHGRPICVVRVRLHRQGEQCEESLERYTVYLIETARMLLSPPVDTATILFDMTGFSMANMDYAPVKFMIKCFEANYPESLGAVLVHKAPWVFQGIWKIIRSWLDPVVASKVHFTNNMKDVEEFIPQNHILKELDGKEDYEYKYVEPVPGENDIMKDAAARELLLVAREELVKSYESKTWEWVQAASGEQGKVDAINAERNTIAEKLRINYWQLDPYVRARSYYDRIKVLQPGGTVVPYPEAKLDLETAEKAPAVTDNAVDSDKEVDLSLS